MPKPLFGGSKLQASGLQKGPFATAKQHLIACRNRAQTYPQKLPNVPSEFLVFFFFCLLQLLFGGSKLQASGLQNGPFATAKQHLIAAVVLLWCCCNQTASKAETNSRTPFSKHIRNSETPPNFVAKTSQRNPKKGLTSLLKPYFKIKTLPLPAAACCCLLLPAAACCCICWCLLLPAAACGCLLPAAACCSLLLPAA